MNGFLLRIEHLAPHRVADRPAGRVSGAPARLRQGLRDDPGGAAPHRANGLRSAVGKGLRKRPGKGLWQVLWLGLLLLGTSAAYAGGQRQEPLSAAVRSLLQRSVADSAAPRSGLSDPQAEREWLNAVLPRMAQRMPDLRARIELLRTVHYEASRAGLEPELVLAVIQVESGFHKYAVSPVGARGLMQVMPFWLTDIGAAGQDLFHLRTNLRFGCTILRYYLDQEHGDLYRALGRYNGSLGQAAYPGMVLAAWKRDWHSSGLTSLAGTP